MNFSIKITGFALDGFDLEKAKNDFSVLFKTDKERVNQLFNAEKEVTIKKKISQSDALFYHEKLNSIGIENIIIQPDGVPLEPSEKDSYEMNETVFRAQPFQSISWIKTGIQLFSKCPIKWILTTLSWIAPIIIIGIIPAVGQVISVVLMLSMLPGLMYAAEKLDNGHDFTIVETFKALRKAIPLFVFYICSVLIMIIPMIWAFYSYASGGLAGSLLPFLMTIFIYIIVMMAYFFSGPLIVLKNKSLISALKMSILGCIKNIIPLFIFCIAISFIHIVGLLLLGVGLLISTPIVMASFYAAYRDIYLKR